MIKRHYFMAAKTISEDGITTASSSALIDITTEIEEPYRAYESLLKSLSDDFAKSGYDGNVLVVSFNRI